jgi:hypothetical protein
VLLHVSRQLRAWLIFDVGQKTMSWDIFVQDIPKEANSPADIPDDFKPKPIGLRSEVIGKILTVVPFADFSDPSWGIIDGQGFSIEVNLGDNEMLNGFAFHVRGGDLAAFAVADILERLGRRAFDPNSKTGIFTITQDGSDGQQRWCAYRDRVLAQK